MPSPSVPIEEKFEAYHAINRRVYAVFMKFARQMKVAGFTSYSARAILGRVRWHYDLDTSKTSYERRLIVSNDYAEYYARKAVELHPEFHGFFDEVVV